MRILVLNGPNLARLDLRDSAIYGSMTFPDLVTFITAEAAELGFVAEVRQTDSESQMIGWLHEAADGQIPVVINPAAFTHYSYAIRDAAELVKAPLIEVHLSNPLAREEFRHTSVISGIANGTIAGFGPDSYRLALMALARMVK
ncbi:MAG: type II 3-dehydroquinate dehydratase [Actinomycetes bacterium]